MAYATRRSYAGAAPACTLTNSITAGDTSALLTGDVTNWTTTASGPFFMVIDPGLSTEEKVLVGSRTGSSLSSITRGMDGTTAASHSAGASCYPVFTAIDADEANAAAAALTTKGDLLVTTGSALNRLGVGTNDYALLADSSATNGVAWGQIPAAGLATDSVTQVKIADRAVGSAELTNLTLNAQTGTSYTFVLADAQKLVTLSNAASITATVPPNASVAFTVGDQINLLQLDAGQVTVAAGAGVTVSSADALLALSAQYAVGTLVKTGTDAWVLVGNLA